ncbi:MAG: hypothetical protein CL784_09410 [Chloroflexi bacterium]|nr:hypothetical protein [Chloroflexota bacterium]
MLVENLQKWSEFAFASAHLLRRGDADWPANKILLQVASEENPAGPVYSTAAQWLNQGHCNWLWLRNIRSNIKERSPGKIAALEGHNSIVVGFIPGINNKQFYTVGRDQNLKAWSNSGELLFTNSDGAYQGGNGEGGPFSGFEKEGGQIASISSVSGDNSINILDPQGTLITSLRGHSEKILGIRPCPNGNLISWSFDNTIRIWNPSQESCVAILTPPIKPSGIYGKCGTAPLVLPNGNIFSWEGKLQLWDSAGKKIAQSDAGHFFDHKSGVIALNNSHILAWNGKEDMRIYCGEALKLIGQFCGSKESQNFDSILGGKIGEPLQLLDGSILTYGRTIQIWDPNTLELLNTMPGHDGMLIKDVIELPNGNLVSSAGEDNEPDDIRLWQSKDGKNIKRWNDPTRTSERLAALPDGRFISYARLNRSRKFPLNTGEICLWDPRFDKKVATFKEHSEAVYGVRVLTNGNIVSWAQDQSMYMWDVSEIKAPENQDADVTSHTTAIALTKDLVLLKNNESPDMTALNIISGNPVYEIDGHDAPAVGALPLPDGRVLSWGIDIRIWEEGRLVLHKIPNSRGPLKCWIGPKNLVLTSYVDDSIELWDLSTGKTVVRQNGYTGVSEAIILPNGGFFALCWDTLRIHTPEAQENCQVFKSKELKGFPTMFKLADGGILAWANHIFLFSGDTGKCLNKTNEETNRARGACTLSNGRIAIWFDDGTVQLRNSKSLEPTPGLEDKMEIQGASDWDEELFALWSKSKLFLVNKKTHRTIESLRLQSIFQNTPEIFAYWLAQKNKNEVLQKGQAASSPSSLTIDDKDIFERSWKATKGLHHGQSIHPHTISLMLLSQEICEGKIFWNGTGQWNLLQASDSGAIALYNGSCLSLVHLFKGDQRLNLSEAANLLSSKEG